MAYSSSGFSTDTQEEFWKDTGSRGSHSDSQQRSASAVNRLNSNASRSTSHQDQPVLDRSDDWFGGRLTLQ